MQDPIFVFDLSSPVSTDMPLPADILRDYTLEFEGPCRLEGVLEKGCQGHRLLQGDC